MNNKVLSLEKSILIRYTFNGIMWLIVGVLQFINYKPVEVIGGIVLVIAATYTMIFNFRKTDIEDEMAELHLGKAHKFSLSFLFLLMIIIYIVAQVLESKVVISYISVFPFIFGISQILVGLLFYLYEKVGD